MIHLRAFKNDVPKQMKLPPVLFLLVSVMCYKCDNYARLRVTGVAAVAVVIFFIKVVVAMSTEEVGGF